MTDCAIVTAAMRRHSANTARMIATTASNKFKSEQKRRTGFGGADCELSRRVTVAKRTELAALRTLAKLCTQARGQQVDDADVIDLPALLTFD